MEPYTNSHFAIQPTAPADPASSTDPAAPTMNGNLNPEVEASGAQDQDMNMDIKRETSDGLNGDTHMADIPALGNKTEPRSSQPPPLSLHGTADPSEEALAFKPAASARAAGKKGTATLVKKTTSRKAAGGSRASKGARGPGKSGPASASSKVKPSNRVPGPGPSPSDPSAGPASSPAPAAQSSDFDGGPGGSEDDESDHGPYCLCQGPDDHRWMISCDVCEDWFHGECVSIDKTVGEALIQRYVCPRCTDDKGINVTRYRKTCSLDGCLMPARIYEDAGGVGGRKKPGPGARGNYSVFCSDRHAEDWWEQLVRSLPENGRLKAKEADLTRERFMGLLGADQVQNAVEGEEPWSIGKKPFAIPDEFWSKVDHSLILTPEEQSFLSTSAADRYALAEEIVLNKKMQQLLDLANERRKAAIAAGLIDKDTCGYDARLDLVGCPAEFAAFARSAQGEAIYRTSSLSSENTWTESQLAALRRVDTGAGGVGGGDGENGEDDDGAGFDPATAGMCDRRRCKPHASWYNLFTKGARAVIKELARQAKEKLDAETRVREAAATRYFRRAHARTTVRRLDGALGV